ncbi:MAG: hypothetical protein M9913_14715 [Bryobacteraceae bacterium]|nr:hypothetical protein [Bryobacteraceae bacterium]
MEVFEFEGGEAGLAEEGGGIESGVAVEAATEQGMEEALAAAGGGVGGGGDMFEKKVSAAGLEDAADLGESGGGVMDRAEGESGDDGGEGVVGEGEAFGGGGGPPGGDVAGFGGGEAVACAEGIGVGAGPFNGGNSRVAPEPAATSRTGPERPAKRRSLRAAARRL